MLPIFLVNNPDDYEELIIVGLCADVRLFQLQQVTSIACKFNRVSTYELLLSYLLLNQTSIFFNSGIPGSNPKVAEATQKY